MLPDLRPDISNLRAIVTTRWGDKGYRPVPVYNIESYYVDTALDNDADTWVCEIGDPNGDFIEFAGRDNEIRVQLFGPGSVVSSTNYLLTGIADDAAWGDGTWTLTGRDYSSLATDSTVPPQHFRHVRAWAVVEQQAKKLGFSRVKLAHGKMVRKIQFTDGSESYWDFWWRLYRKEQMWIWCDPDGTLIASTLNYGNSNDYYFGTPISGDSTAVRRQHIPIVAQPEIHKTTQQRVGEVHVWWHKGDNGARTIVKDPTMANWKKRPIKVMLDTDAHSENAAKKTALEEIFEGKVGSVEYRITIPDPGFPVRTNRVARLNLPDLGITGQFFVVGARYQAGPDGLLQQIRLREKQFAVTRRIPTDPKKKLGTPGAATSASLGAGIESVITMPRGWGDYFAKAAKQWHGPWNYQFFLATLIGIAMKETGIRNIRQNGGPGGDGNEWYPYKTLPDSVQQHQHNENIGVPETRSNWEEKFANEAGDGYISWEAGAGPMQLTSRSLKNAADDRLRVNFRDEFSGGRWHPEHNIWIAAKYLRECLQATVGDSGRDIDMWMGVSAYNKGPGGARLQDPYALSVKNYVYNDPGYLNSIKQAVDEAATRAKAANADTANDPITVGPLGSLFPYASHVIGLPGQGTHSFIDPPNNWQSDNAVDISASFGTPVYAVHDGAVGSWGVLPDSGRGVWYSEDEMKTVDRFGGNRINIDGKTQSTYYAHLSRINTTKIKDGAYVKRGDLIGWTGIANGSPHLHFGCQNGSPLKYLPGVHS